MAMGATANPTEYGKFLSRALRAYGKTLEDSDLYYLPQMIELHSQMEDIVRATVKARLLAGDSWAAIAEALGVPVGTARSRYSVEGYGKGLVVYGLKIEGSGEIRYVGKTKNLGLRLVQHRNSAVSGGHAKVAQWIREVGAENIEPVILERYETDAELTQGEIDWYDRLLAEGAALTNGGRPGQDRHAPGPGGRPRKSREAVLRDREEKAAQRARDEKRNRERQADFARREEERRIERSAAWWSREIAAGRAHVVGSSHN